MYKVPTNRDYSRTRTTWRERAFVFGGIAIAGGVSGIGVPLGAGEEILAPVWLAALAWTILATIAHAFWRGFCRGDWSGFREKYEPSSVNHDAGDMATCTGAYYYRRLIDPRFSYWPGNPH